MRTVSKGGEGIAKARFFCRSDGELLVKTDTFHHHTHTQRAAVRRWLHVGVVIGFLLSLLVFWKRRGEGVVEEAATAGTVFRIEG